MILPPGGRARAPSATVPLRYLVTATGAFLLAAAGTVWLAPELSAHYYQPRVVALTHTVTLGWIMLTVMGASYQLVPIVLERPLWSERLARWQFVVMVVAIAGMVAHLSIATWRGLGVAAAAVGVGVGLHLLNLAWSLRGLRAWSFTARLMALGLCGLALTVGFGVLLAIDRTWKFLPGDFFPTLHAHFHLALLGWVAPTVMGVAARAYPMFLLAKEPAGAAGALQPWGLALGVPAVVVGLLAVPALLVPGAVAVAAAAAGHLAWVWTTVARRKRPTLDWGLRLVLAGSAFVVPTTVLGLGFAADLWAGPRPALAYAVLALGGWVSLTIAGMLLKIVPFLVWYRVYAPRAGRCPVPTLAQLASPGAERAAFVLLGGGVAALAVAVAIGDPWAIRAAGAVVTGGALALAWSLGRTLAHLR
jgi:hypothetical protein